MGWFLGRRKQTGGSKRSAGRGGRGAGDRGDPLAPRWSPERTLAALKLLGAVAGVAAVALSWHIGQRALSDYARTHHAAAITADAVVIEDRPPWMPEGGGLDLELRRLVAEQVGDDPVDNTTLRAAAGALAAWAWVEPGGVHQVVRRADGTVAVSVSLRSPLAVIQARDGYHLVSDEGVRLPALYAREQIERMNVPVLVGASAPPPRRGERWPGRDVEAGLALVRYLMDEPFMDEVAAIDVSGRDGRDRLRLSLLTGSGEVVWGLPPGDERSIEPEAATKLDRLRRVAATRGSIDAGGRVVHLYGATVQVSNPTLDDSADRLGAYSR